MKLLLSSLLHLHSPGSQLGGWCNPWWTGLTASVNLIGRVSHRHAQWLIFQVILDSVSLVTNNNHKCDMVRELMNRELEIRQICTSCIVFIFEKNFYVNQSRVCDSEPWDLEGQSDWLQEFRFLKGLVVALSTITTVYTFVTIVVQWWFEWEHHTLMCLNIGYQWWHCAVCRGSGTF